MRLRQLFILVMTETFLVTPGCRWEERLFYFPAFVVFQSAVSCIERSGRCILSRKKKIFFELGGIKKMLSQVVENLSKLKEALSVLMLCTPVFIFASGSSALSGRPRCGLSI